MKKFLLLLAVLVTGMAAKAELVTDVLTSVSFGLPATGQNGYADFKCNNSNSGTEYTGNMNNQGKIAYIQLRSSKSTSGVINATSKGKLTKVVLTWNSNTSTSAMVDVYGKATPYSAPSDLYGTANQGTKIGSIYYGGTTVGTLNITDEAKQYDYIGLRSNDGTVYLDKVELTWDVQGEVAVAKPAFAPGSGIVDAGTAVKLSCATEGASIYYTMGEDPADPTAESTLYDDATGIVVNDWCTIKAIAIKGDESSEVASAQYSITPEIESLSMLADFPDGTPFFTAMPMTVVYVNGNNIYVHDGNSYGLLYNQKNVAEIKALTPGDVIKAGLKSTVTIFNGLTEFVPVTAVEVEDEKGTVPAPTPVAPDMAAMMAQSSINSYWLIEGVTFPEATPAEKANFTGYGYDEDYNETELNFRNNFTLASQRAGTYDVKCFVGIYNTTIQFYPVEFELCPVKVENFMSLADIPADTEIEFVGESYVLYAAGGKAYLADAYSNIPVVFNTVDNVAIGDKLVPGWHGMVVDNHGVTEISILEDVEIDGKQEHMKQAVPVEADDAEMMLAPYMVNTYLTLTGVELAAATTAEVENYEGYLYTSEGEKVTVTFRNEFELASVAAGLYDITGFVGLYEDTQLFYPTEIKKNAPVIEDLSPISDFEVGTAFTMGGTAKTVYAGAKAAYITSGNFNVLVASDEALGIETSDVILPGWTGEVAELMGMTAVKVTSAMETAEEKADTILPIEVAPDEAEMMLAPYMVNSYLKLQEVELAAATTELFEGTITPATEGAEALTVKFANFFELGSVAAGCYNVSGFVATVDGEVAFYPVAFEATTSGIAGIAADGAEAATYYNLQGVKVAKPAAGGVYIRVAGGKAQKVVL